MTDTLCADGVLVLGENETPDMADFIGADGPGIYAKSRAAIARAS
jgi:hypothetical protein